MYKIDNSAKVLFQDMVDASNKEQGEVDDEELTRLGQKPSVAPRRQSLRNNNALENAGSAEPANPNASGQQQPYMDNQPRPGE